MLENADLARWGELVAGLSSQNSTSSRSASLPALESLPASLKSPVTHFQYKPAGRYDWWDVDTLLNQAADLIDRCMATRREHTELAYRALDLQLAIDEIEAASQIEAAERAAGLFTLPALESGRQLDKISLQLNTNHDLRVLIDTRLNQELEPTILEQLQRSAACAALASTTERFEPKSATPGLTIDPTLRRFPCPEPTHNDFTNSDHASASAVKHFQFSLQETLFNARSIRLSNDAREKELTAERDVLQPRHEWNKASIQFREARFALAQRLAKEKGLALRNRDGAFNFDSKAQAAAVRLCADLNDAVERITAAAEGLDTLFGYIVALPQGPDPSRPHDGVDLDALYLWLRNALAFLVAFQLRDQIVTLPVSLRTLIGDAAWDAGVATGSWSVDLSPDRLVSASVLPVSFHCARLRSVAATVATDPTLDTRPDVGAWQLLLEAPREAKYLPLTASAWIDVHQEAVNRCMLGRVERPQSARPVDRGGGDALFNLSPFGRWHLACSNVSTAGVKRALLRDIVLEFQMACRLDVA